MPIIENPVKTCRLCGWKSSLLDGKCWRCREEQRAAEEVQDLVSYIYGRRFIEVHVEYDENKDLYYASLGERDWETDEGFHYPHLAVRHLADRLRDHVTDWSGWEEHINRRYLTN